MTGPCRIYTAYPSSTKDKDKERYIESYWNIHSKRKSPENEVSNKRKSSQILYKDFQKYEPLSVLFVFPKNLANHIKSLHLLLY